MKTDLTPGVGKVVYEIKEPATKAHDLNLTPRTHMGKEKTPTSCPLIITRTLNK